MGGFLLSTSMNPEHLDPNLAWRAGYRRLTYPYVSSERQMLLSATRQLTKDSIPCCWVKIEKEGVELWRKNMTWIDEDSLPSSNAV
jgi:hypothetical protein